MSHRIIGVCGYICGVKHCLLLSWPSNVS